MRKAVLALVILATAVISPSPAAATTSTVKDVGVAVYDRAQHKFVKRTNATKQFRSASIVKLLIALDLVWDLGGAVPAEDRAKLDLMLRSSDDDAAQEFWVRNGRGLIVERMAA